MKSQLASKSVNGVFWNFVEKFSSQGIHFITGLVLANILSPSEFGLIGMIVVFMAISQTFIDFGFTHALIQKKNRTETDYSTVFLTNLGISLFIYAILYAGAPFIARFYNITELVWLTRVLALNIIFFAFLSIYKTRLTIQLDFKTQAKASLTAGVLSGILGIGMALAGFGVWSLVIQSLTNTLFTFGILLICTRWKPGTRFSKESFRPMFSFGSKLLVSNLINTTYTNLYSLVIGKRYSSSDLGLYSRADQFVKFPSVNIGLVISRVNFPILSSIQDDSAKLSWIYMRYLAMISYVVFPLMIFLAVFAEPIIRILLTDEWIESGRLLQILCFAYIWDPISIINTNVLYVKGRSDIVLKLEILKKTIAIGILAITFSYGIEIMCIGKVVYSLIAVTITGFVSGKFLDNSIIAQAVDILKYFFLALIAGVAAYFCQMLFTNDWLKLIAGTLAGGGIFIIISRFLRLEPYRDLIEIARARLQKRHPAN